MVHYDTVHLHWSKFISWHRSQADAIMNAGQLLLHTVTGLPAGAPIPSIHCSAIPQVQNANIVLMVPVERLQHMAWAQWQQPVS
jgi:hypothetical protein